MKRLAVLTVLAVLGLASSTSALPSAHARSWIDAPLSSTLVTTGPVEIVAHATDPGGVTEVRLDVNGVTVADVAPEPMGGTFVIARLSWTPTADGLHRLDVYARNRAGEWGPPATTRVTVQSNGDTTTATTTTTDTTTIPTGPTTTARTTPTTTPPTTRPTPTVVPTTAVTTTVAPATTVCTVGLPSPTGVARTDTLNPVLTWSYQGCRPPEQFQLQVSLDPGFGALAQSGSVGGNQRSWSAGPLRDCLTYYWRIRTSSAGSSGPWVNGGAFTIIASSCDG